MFRQYLIMIHHVLFLQPADRSHYRWGNRQLRNAGRAHILGFAYTPGMQWVAEIHTMRGILIWVINDKEGRHKDVQSL